VAENCGILLNEPLLKTHFIRAFELIITKKPNLLTLIFPHNPQPKNINKKNSVSFKKEKDMVIIGS